LPWRGKGVKGRADKRTREERGGPRRVRAEKRREGRERDCWRVEKGGGDVWVRRQLEIVNIPRQKVKQYSNSLNKIYSLRLSYDRLKASVDLNSIINDVMYRYYV